jgi:hypothetical protein
LAGEANRIPETLGGRGVANPGWEASGDDPEQRGGPNDPEANRAPADQWSAGPPRFRLGHAGDSQAVKPGGSQVSDLENVEKVEADRPGIGLSDKDAQGEGGDPNVSGGEPTTAAPEAPSPEPPVNDDDA